MEYAHQLIAAGVEILKASHPAWLLLALAFLPLVGMPVSPLWIAAGIRLGPVWGLVAVAVGAVVNNSLSYWLAARWLREPLKRWMDKRGYALPVMENRDEIKLVLICRLIPGFPLPIQNYMLGCARVNFGWYLLISFPLQTAWGCAFVFLGDSLNHNSAIRVVMMVCLLVAVGLIFSLARKRFGRGADVKKAN